MIYTEFSPKKCFLGFFFKIQTKRAEKVTIEQNPRENVFFDDLIKIKDGSWTNTAWGREGPRSTQNYNFFRRRSKEWQTNRYSIEVLRSPLKSHKPS